MSRPKPKSAMAALLESQEKASEFLSAEVGTAERAVFSESFFQTTLGENSSNDARLIEVDPHDCRLWAFADRPETEFGDIDELARSMKETGQQEPVLVRASQNNTKEKYEVIFGNRRWRAAKRVGIKLLAIIKELTDQEAALCQKEENENRQEISDLTRAISYSKLIEKKIFESEIDLCNKLKLNQKTLNDIMSYIRVPEILRESIPNFSKISRVTAIKLATIAKDPKKIDILLKLAPKIGDRIVNGSNLDKYISNLIVESTPASQPSIVIVNDKQGRPVIKISQKTNGTYNINIDQTLANKLGVKDLKKHLSELLELVS